MPHSVPQPCFPRSLLSQIGRHPGPPRAAPNHQSSPQPYQTRHPLPSVMMTRRQSRIDAPGCRSAQKHQLPVVCERRLISSSIPPICGSKANKMRRSMAKSSGAGRIMPPDIHATSLIAASVWRSAACPTLVIAASRSWRRSATKASRSRQNFPTPPLHSRSRAAMASASAAWALVTAGVPRDARTSGFAQLLSGVIRYVRAIAAFAFPLQLPLAPMRFFAIGIGALGNG